MVADGIQAPLRREIGSKLGDVLVRQCDGLPGHDTFRAHVPEKHGMCYRHFSLAQDDAVDFDAALSQMKHDLSMNGANTVFVTRGPWMSWMASFYLESLPLAGLVSWV